MMARAFVPGHITGFFEIFEGSNELTTGARGCGVVIDKGVETTVELEEGEAAFDIEVNEKECSCPVTLTALKMVFAGVEEKYSVHVNHSPQIPVGQGFGASASGSLGAVLALNDALNLKMTVKECGDIAHNAEVLNKTGLGDVIAECSSGIALREKAGAPSVGRVRRIPCDKAVVVFIIGSKLETRDVLADEMMKRAIKETGSECMKLIHNHLSVENFLKLSRKFAVETGLMREEILSAVKQLEEAGIVASMSMLGNSVFTLTRSPDEVCKVLSYPHIVAGIDNKGARVLRGV